MNCLFFRYIIPVINWYRGEIKMPRCESPEQVLVAWLPINSMVILSRYEINFKPSEDLFWVKTKEISICPCCGQPLSGYDHHLRLVRLRCGIKVRLLVPRAFCRSCHRLHTQLPSFVQPNKHYEAMVIQQVMDGKTLSTCPAEDSTIRRWQSALRHAAPYLEMLLYAANQAKRPLFGESLLEKLRKSSRRWLTFVTHLLISARVDLPTCFAFTPPG